MNTSELRIGNWVNAHLLKFYDDGHPNFAPAQIGRLPEDAKAAHSPIPLTTEILLKAGFTNETFYYEKDEICIREIDGKFYALAMWVPLESETNTLIDSVHYLQNFYFFIIGRELNIKLL